MLPAIACATISRINHTERNVKYVCINVTTGVNESLKELISQRPYADDVQFQMHATTVDLIGVVIQLKPLIHYNDVVIDLVKLLQHWHEIESGWLDHTPPLEIRRLKKKKLVKETFSPDRGSVRFRLGRTLFKKEWAIIESKTMMISLYTRRESELRRQLT